MTASPPQTDGRFKRIRQVTPMCRPMRAHCRHLVNTIELMLPSAHPSPQPSGISIGSAVFDKLLFTTNGSNSKYNKIHN